MANPVKGLPGYTYSTIVLTVSPASYLGDGVNGWNGGTQYSFNVRERDLEVLRARQDTTDGPYSEGVGGPVGRRVSISGYFKGSLIPPLAGGTTEFVRITARVGFLFDGVIMVESFKESGVIDNSLQWTLSGTTDGTFTVTA